MKLSSALLTICFVALGSTAAESQTAPPSALKITIAVPELSLPGPGSRMLINQQPDAHFHVVIENVSAQPVHIWDEGNSEGWSTLSFEITNANGSLIKVTRPDIARGKNLIRTDQIDPGETLVRDIYYATDNITGAPKPPYNAWSPGFPFETGRDKIVTIRAIFEQLASPTSERWNVWTGKAVSKPYTVTLTGG